MDKNFLDQVIAELISGLSDSIAAIAAATARTGNAQAFQEAYTAELAHIQRSTPTRLRCSYPRKHSAPLRGSQRFSTQTSTEARHAVPDRQARKHAHTGTRSSAAGASNTSGRSS